MPYKEFLPQQLTAAEVNSYLMRQTVMVFANSADRLASLTNPTEGMVTYLMDTNAAEYYSGSAWVSLGTSLLSGLSDVAISSPTTGQALVYNAGTGKWVNTTASTDPMNDAKFTAIITMDVGV